MHHRFLPKVNSIAMLSTISLLVLLVGCGQDSTSNPRQISKSTASNLGQTSRGTAPLPNNDSLAIDADGLHIQSLTGIECPPASAPNRIPPKWLVLAKNRVTYDTGELQQMIGYVSAFNQ